MQKQIKIQIHTQVQIQRQIQMHMQRQKQIWKQIRIQIRMQIKIQFETDLFPASLEPYRTSIQHTVTKEKNFLKRATFNTFTAQRVEIY